jgi:hypothetical protein
MTNQASEDELMAEILTEFKQVHKLAPADYTENCTNVVMSLIRTEKLKLLAEVRERVIGENDRGTITDPDSPSYGEQYESAMADKDDLRAALTQLEAEL